ncbi:CoA transferase [Egibacter rhizosphaerae]|uniref:CoA transferase n=1 Tax=Egibacter rhizosphaerae TaxID=1670831 RepID=A0A411YD27_9ACTN|nr:CoA transferase [Egibacter rhizosphaerae]QBI19085.1 CoA transferase [Egibacter rhizosphaerae]
MPGGPLDGVRVVDLTRAMAGPYATLMLADAGAEVTKVERPGSGDDTRGWGPPFLEPEGDGERQAGYFLSVNRNKRSVTLDLKDADDIAWLHRLVDAADVIVENFRPGVMERLGLDEESLATRNPRLVGLSITGFGEGGPHGHRSGFDQILQGEGGLMSLTGPVGGTPTKVGVPIADILAGMFGAYGVTAALVERERSGRGQWVRTSLLGGMVAIHTFQGTRWLLAGEVPQPGGNRHPSIQPYGAFDCADGQVNIAVGSEGLWKRFAPLVGLEPDDPRFATNGDRVERIEELEAAMGPALASDTVKRWVARLEEAGVPAGKVAGLDEVYASAQVAHLGLIDEVAHPTLGDLQLPGAPVHWSRTPRGAPAPPPLLGEHNEGSDG